MRHYTTKGNGTEQKNLMDPQLTQYKANQHQLPHKEIAGHAKKIIDMLIQAGFDAYLVGGAVRDLLLGLHPKDFDIATNATPEQIKSVFRNKCRLIGRRFRLAHVYMGNAIYEIATFRGGSSGDLLLKKGQIIRDNVFGAVDEDALRRDFSCNALYYDINSQTILDYTGGVKDIQQGQLKLIGNPDSRFTEDPVRMLRAVRFHSKLGLHLSDELKKSIIKNRNNLKNVPTARLFDEAIKMFHCGNMLHAFDVLIEVQLFEILFPAADRIIEKDKKMKSLLYHAFKNTDQRLKNNQSVTPVFLTACVLWLEFLLAYQHIINKGKNPHDALHTATTLVMEQQRPYLAIPKAIQNGIRQIWLLQLRFKKMSGKPVYSTLHHPRFRAAYDFLLLRGQIKTDLSHQTEFWTNIQTMSPEGIKSMIFGKHIKHKKTTPEL